jgi:hypothetical protein
MNTVSWDSAVEEGTQLAKNIEQGQMRLGQIADELEPKYGDSTLARYAQEIGININTLQNYRSVFRTWHEDPRVKEVPKFSVAKALVKHPDRAKIVAEMPDITEREAKEKTKEFKEQAAKYEHYPMETMHKLTLKIVTRFDSFLKEHSPLDDMLNMVVVHNSSDFEYLYKIIRALGRVDDRVGDAMERMGVIKDSYETEVEKPNSEEEKAIAAADEEAFQEKHNEEHH